MGISKKNRRSITVDNARFLWWVAEDEDSPFGACLPALTVISEDRLFFVRYHLQQPDEHRHITVLGPDFRGIEGCGGRWRRFRCPAFGNAGEIRPRDVAALIRWCKDKGMDSIEVNYLGLQIAD